MSYRRLDVAEAAFRDATTRLNSKNLSHLWSWSALLSSLDYLPRVFTHEETPPFLPSIHPMKIGMFVWAVLKSKALDYKTQRLSRADFIYVFNRLNDAAADPNFLDTSGDEPPEARLLRHFSTMVNKQWRFQSKDFLFRCARTFLLFEELPKRHAAVLKQRLGSSYLDIPAMFEYVTGLKAKDALFLGFAIISLLRARLAGLLKQSRARLAVQPGSNLPNRQAGVLLSLLESAAAFEGLVKFTKAELPIPSNMGLPPSVLNSYFAQVARDTRQLRQLTEEGPYTHGFLSYRLNPLERYPLVQLNGFDDVSFVVPSIPYLDRLATDLPHFVLQESDQIRQRYHETRGHLQELYLSDLFQKRLSDHLVIEERAYRRRGENWRGPDFIVCDPKDQRLILIESKALRVQARTLADTGLEALIQDLRDAVAAIKRLPTKVGHLKEGLPEYSDVQQALDACLGKQPVAVLVVSEAVEMFAEKVELARRSGRVRGLEDYPYPYCFMDLETLEFAVELAASGQASLSAVLEEYWRTGSGAEASALPADRFGGRTLEAKDVYLVDGASRLLDSWR